MCVPLETGMNTLPNGHKECHFNRTKSPLYLVKLKMVQNGRLFLQCVLLNRLFQNFAESRYFPSLLENSFSSLLAENILHSHGFLSEIYLQTQYG